MAGFIALLPVIGAIASGLGGIAYGGSQVYSGYKQAKQQQNNRRYTRYPRYNQQNYRNYKRRFY